MICNPPESIYCGKKDCPVCGGLLSSTSPFTLSDLVRQAREIILEHPESAHFPVNLVGTRFNVESSHLNVDVQKKRIELWLKG